MGSETKIEWAHNTFNPWTGCTKVSPGCSNCYAEGWAKRSGVVKWGKGEPRRRTSPANWRDPIKWSARAEKAGIRERVFSASLADVFDPEAPQEWRDDLFALIRKTPWLDWLLLSKRIGLLEHDQIMATLPKDWGTGYPNVWLGATVENQAMADLRVAALLKIPAVIHFLSMEPLLGEVCLRSLPANLEYKSGKWAEVDYFDALTGGCGIHDMAYEDGYLAGAFQKIDWVIVGGESGPGARPMHPDWARSLRDQCAAAGVPFLFKQHGEWVTEDQSPEDICLPGQSFAPFAQQDGDGEWSKGDQTAFFKVGKKAAGRLLDGAEHNGFPEMKV